MPMGQLVDPPPPPPPWFRPGWRGPIILDGRRQRELDAGDGSADAIAGAAVDEYEIARAARQLEADSDRTRPLLDIGLLLLAIAAVVVALVGALIIPR